MGTYIKDALIRVKQSGHGDISPECGGIPESMQRLFTQWTPSEVTVPENIEMDEEDSVLSDWGIEHNSIIHMQTNPFDKEGRFIFYDEYWEQDKKGVTRLQPRPKTGFAQHGETSTRWV